MASRYRKRRLKLKRHDHPSAKRMGRMVLAGKMLPKGTDRLKPPPATVDFSKVPW